MTLKQKTISGLLWSFIDNFASLGISFIIGLILARLLSPTEFGLIGMLTIFISISQSFIDSGFSQALIRKNDTSQIDYSTVFYFNLVIGVICYLILFFCAGLIASFFNEPQLKLLMRILGLSLIINSLSIIQRTILTQRIDFKLQTRISIISAIFSGIIGIGFALAGYGVWSLVIKTIISYLLTTLLLWLWNNWKPIFVFSIKSFKELFSFGSKLLISGLIDVIYKNFYYLIIGKYFSIQELGYYTRADQFNALPSTTITTVINRVSYPVLSSIQSDNEKLKDAYKKLIRSTMFVTAVLMLGLAAIARSMVLTLIGIKWEPCIIYLQLLCFVGLLYPLHALNLNILSVKGRSDLFLRLEIIKKIISIPIIIIAVFFGIKIMILGMFFTSIFAYYLNSYYSGKLIGYPILDQMKDILPSFMLASTMAALVFAVGFLPLAPLFLFVLQLLTGVLLTVGLGEIFRFKDYLYIKQNLIELF